MRYFRPEEFACRCGCGLGLDNMNQAFLARLLRARGLSEAPFVLTSAVRCKEHNRAVGGSGASSHLTGQAVDIAAPDGRARYQILTSLIGAGFERIGVGADFIHVDSDPAKPGEVIWVY